MGGVLLSLHDRFRILRHLKAPRPPLDRLAPVYYDQRRMPINQLSLEPASRLAVGFVGVDRSDGPALLVVSAATVHDARLELEQAVAHVRRAVPPGQEELEAVDPGSGRGLMFDPRDGRGATRRQLRRVQRIIEGRRRRGEERLPRKERRSDRKGMRWCGNGVWSVRGAVHVRRGFTSCTIAIVSDDNTR
eukprot:247603-Prorocentrum_minimum.AAC.2